MQRIGEVGAVVAYVPRRRQDDTTTRPKPVDVVNTQTVAANQPPHTVARREFDTIIGLRN